MKISKDTSIEIYLEFDDNGTIIIKQYDKITESFDSVYLSEKEFNKIHQEIKNRREGK